MIRYAWPWLLGFFNRVDNILERLLLLLLRLRSVDQAKRRRGVGSVPHTAARGRVFVDRETGARNRDLIFNRARA